MNTLSNVFLCENKKLYYECQEFSTFIEAMENAEKLKLKNWTMIDVSIFRKMFYTRKNYLNYVENELNKTFKQKKIIQIKL